MISTLDSIVSLTCLKVIYDIANIVMYCFGFTTYFCVRLIFFVNTTVCAYECVVDKLYTNSFKLNV